MRRKVSDLGRLLIVSDSIAPDDATKVERADIVSFKDARPNTVSNVTMRNVCIAALTARFQYAIDQGALTQNPVLGVKVRVKEALREREQSSTQDEAQAVLKATLAPAGTNHLSTRRRDSDAAHRGEDRENSAPARWRVDRDLLGWHNWCRRMLAQSV